MHILLHYKTDSTIMSYMKRLLVEYDLNFLTNGLFLIYINCKIDLLNTLFIRLMSIDDAWMRFISNETGPGEVKDSIPSIVPTCGPIIISTKTKILYFNIKVDLNEIFWKFPMISYDSMKEGIIKNK